MADLTYQDVKKIIDAKTDEILDMIDLSSSLRAALKRENVITAAVADKLRVASNTDHEKVELILTSIRQRGPESFLKFCKVLNEKDHQHVLKVLGVVVQGNTINVRKVSAKQVQMQTGAVSGQWAAGPTYHAGTASVGTPFASNQMFLNHLQELDGQIDKLNQKNPEKIRVLGPTYRAGTASVGTPFASNQMFLNHLQEIDGQIEQLKHKK